MPGLLEAAVVMKEAKADQPVIIVAAACSSHRSR